MKRIIQYMRKGYARRTQVEETTDGTRTILVQKGTRITIDGTQYEQISRSPRIGVMVGVGPGKIGFVLFSPYETRKPNWKWAIELATKRALGDAKNPNIPKWAEDCLCLFEDRTSRYFCEDKK